MVASTWQARIARQQRERAERRFNDVRKLANSILFELHDAIVPLAGSTKARELLLRRAQEYLDSLALEAKDDAPLQRERALAYLRIGDVMGGTSQANLGKTARRLKTSERRWPFCKDCWPRIRPTSNSSAIWALPIGASAAST